MRSYFKLKTKPQNLLLSRKTQTTQSRYVFDLFIVSIIIIRYARQQSIKAFNDRFTIYNATTHISIAFYRIVTNQVAS